MHKPQNQGLNENSARLREQWLAAAITFPFVGSKVIDLSKSIRPFGNFNDLSRIAGSIENRA